MASPTGLRVFRAVITAFLVFIFFTAGAMKLTDRFSAKTHLKMVGITFAGTFDRELTTRLKFIKAG